MGVVSEEVVGWTVVDDCLCLLEDPPIVSE